MFWLPEGAAGHWRKDCRVFAAVQPCPASEERTLSRIRPIPPGLHHRASTGRRTIVQLWAGMHGVVPVA